jgi:DNA-binding NarL/FixJ family response regulator
MMGSDDLIRVVIAEERRMFREGLRRILDQEEGITIVGEATNAQQTVEVVSQLQPDVLLLDLFILAVDGVEVIDLLKRSSPNTKQLILATSTDSDLILKHLKAGAKGYLTKDASVFELIKAIRTLTQGELWIERKLLTHIVEREAMASPGPGSNGNGGVNGKAEPMTPREQEVLNLLSAGKTNKEIARILVISEKTVKSHLNKIFRKLRVHRRLQAAIQTLKMKS